MLYIIPPSKETRLPSYSVRIFLIVIVFLVLGCNSVKSYISVFHQLKEANMPVTYLFLPLENQKDSLEYMTYKQRISAELLSHNYVEVDNPTDAEVLVAFDYGTNDGKEFLSPASFLGQSGVSSSTSVGTTSTHGDDTSQTEDGIQFRLTIFDNAAAKNGKARELYKASLKSRGGAAPQSAIIPAMIQALFKDFPGKNGSVRQEILTMD